MVPAHACVSYHCQLPCSVSGCGELCLGVYAHTAHFCLKVDSPFLPYSVKDRGDLGGKERGTSRRDGSDSSQRPGHP